MTTAIVVAAGLVSAAVLVLAWLFELTPTGLTLELIAGIVIDREAEVKGG